MRFPKAILLVFGFLMATTFLWVADYYGILTSRFNGKTAALKHMFAPVYIYML